MDLGVRRQPGRQARQIIFVDLGAQLVRAFGIDLAQRIALLDRLTWLEIEIGQTAGDRRGHGQGGQALPNLGQGAAQVICGAEDLFVLVAIKGRFLRLGRLQCRQA